MALKNTDNPRSSKPLVSVTTFCSEEDAVKVSSKKFENWTNLAAHAYIVIRRILISLQLYFARILVTLISYSRNPNDVIMPDIAISGMITSFGL